MIANLEMKFTLYTPSACSYISIKALLEYIRVPSGAPVITVMLIYKRTFPPKTELREEGVVHLDYL
jgi:hypothetical protein